MKNGFSKRLQKINQNGRVKIGGSEYSSLESVDDRIICLMRLLLATAATAITYIDPTSPDRLVELTYSLLICYCLYSALLYFLARRDIRPVSIKAIPWIDATWYAVLISLSNGTNSIFFFFFFFSILVSAFRTGFGAGVRMTLVSAVLFSLLGYATISNDQQFELNRFLIRPIFLMLFGYLVSYWGGQEIKFKRHLTLLKDVSRLSNPRFGAARTLGDVLTRLRDFYDAESCILITFDAPAANYSWQAASRDRTPNDSLKIEQTAAAAPLVKLPGESLAVFCQNKNRFFSQRTETRAYDVSNDSEVEIAPNVAAALADLLEADSFFTVPVAKRGEIIGRIYLVSPRNGFERSEIEFVGQLTEQVLTVVENVELLDRLASDAATRQREKISRDLHDSTVQPYIGLKLGLEALEIKYAAGAAIEKDFEKLIKLTDQTIGELRGFVKNLQSETGETKGNVLISAVKRQVAKFEEFHGVRMDVQAVDGFYLNDRLAAEAFQIISEGLSNIKRHTKAKNGTISIYETNGKLFLEIENDERQPEAVSNFIPKSIAGRAASLGGAARVESFADRTKVSVEIPL